MVKNAIKITDVQLRVIKEDIEKYWLGQTELGDIAKNRNVPYQTIIDLQKEMIFEKMNAYLKD